MEGSYTAGAQRVLVEARRAAAARKGMEVEPLDLLLALVLDAENRAAELLREIGFDTDELAGWIQDQSSLLEEQASLSAASEELLQELSHSVELRSVLLEAAVTARGFNRATEIGTEHLLAGLITASEEAAAAFEQKGERLLDQLRDRLESPAEEALAALPLAEGVAPLELGEPGLETDLGRLLDASVNRAREGLRVVEDYARFVLDDPAVTRRLKTIRHKLAEAERGLGRFIAIETRDTPGDVGAHIMTPSEQVRENPRAVLVANFKRIQESLRSLEEYCKLVDVWLAGRFEVVRYDVYTVEKLMLTALVSRRTLGDVRLMILAGDLRTPGDLTWVVGEALKAGADAIQFRDKSHADRQRLSLARDLRILTAQARAILIVNDRPDLALLARADGVHVGQEDVSPRDARRVLGASAVVGVSTHNANQLESALLAGASYLGVGPVFPTPTKDFAETELAGLAFVEHAALTTTRPWFAIGGITEDNLKRVLDAGAARIAVSAAVIRASRPGRAVERLKKLLEGGTPEAPDSDDEE